MRHRSLLLPGLLCAALLALPPACSTLVGDFDYQPTGGSSSGSGGATCVDPLVDCPKPAAACLVATCTDGACGTTNADAGAPCAEAGGKVCDGDGACVACNVGPDCAGFPEDTCWAHTCVASSCTDLLEDGDESDVDCGGSCAPCPNAAACASGSDCESGFCDHLACAPCANGADCSGGHYCDLKSGACVVTLGDGEACAAGNQCTSGSCVDGVCCGAPTCQACYACNLSGNGTCSPMPMGVDTTAPATCDGVKSCDGAGHCKAALGQACGAGSDCAAGFCKNGFCAAPPASCVGGGDGAGMDCGAAGTGDCCASLPVPGGTFKRGYDGVTYGDPSFPATVSSFRLDAYEVTVGRFRKFVNAVIGGWLPPAGAGKHVHLPGGGLNAGAEPGWDPAWNVELPPDSMGWKFVLESCSYSGNPQDIAERTWTAAPGAHERRPINCINWRQAYAFCIWDGGFLPSEAEWNLAAAGGDEQRVYAWSSPPTSTTIDCTYANYVGDPNLGYCTATHVADVGSRSPLGNGRWGHADLGGNLWEWVLDGKEGFWSPYPLPCVDCIDPYVGSQRAARGGGFDNVAMFQVTSYMDANIETLGYGHTGMRCARSP